MSAAASFFLASSVDLRATSVASPTLHVDRSVHPSRKKASARATDKKTGDGTKRTKLEMEIEMERETGREENHTTTPVGPD